MMDAFHEDRVAAAAAAGGAPVACCTCTFPLLQGSGCSEGGANWEVTRRHSVHGFVSSTRNLLKFGCF